MDLSIFLFRLFGFYLVILSFGYMFKREFFREALEDFFKSPGLLLVTAIFTLILGLLVVLNYNVWELSPKGLVTLMGWLILFKGVSRLFFPYWGQGFATKIFTGNGTYFAGIISLILGLWLLFSGYA